MSYKLANLEVTPRAGGFLVRVVLERRNVDANPLDDKVDEYIVSTYAKLIKALKSEFAEFKPVPKPRKPKEAK